MADRFIEKLSEWGSIMLEKPDELELAVIKSRKDNKWFDERQQWNAIEAIAENYLDEENLQHWLDGYRRNISEKKKVGVISAGNIPAVGFHDLLSVLVSGHQGKFKLSSRDAHLLPAMINILSESAPDIAGRIEFVDKIEDYDAIIATGSNNSARYFHNYFSHVPHLIRKNRQGIAVLSADVTDDDITALRKDLFCYYGLGCRNVSMILLPQMFNRERLYSLLQPAQSPRENDRYSNNYNYNLALHLLNKSDFKTNDELLFIESEEIHSRIATVHIYPYESIESVTTFLNNREEDIQCVVTDASLSDIKSQTIPVGKSQQPELWEYADGVDTMNFLLNL